MKKTSCPACGFPLSEETLEACLNCGERLSGQVLGENASPPLEEREAPREEKPGGFCPMCGNPVENRHRFCPQCGESLQDSDKPPQPRKKSVKESTASAKKGGTRKKTGTSGIVLQPWQIVTGAVIAAVVIFAIILSTNGNDGDSSIVSHPTQSGATTDLAALQKAEQYVRDHPEDPEGLLSYANLLYDSELFEKASEQYSLYLERNPDNPDARVDYGVCFYMLKKYDKAILEMERAVTDHPNHQLGKFNLGIVNLAAGNSDRALEWFREAIALNPQNDIANKARQIIAEKGATAP